MDRTLIDQYAAGATMPAKSIAGLSRADLQAFPIPGTWSIQQIVIHLMDSDLIGSDRMKRIAAEDNPPLVAYDETRFVQRLAYDKTDAAMACEVFRLNRILTAEMLRNLPDEAFDRTGMHSERGRITLAQQVKGYVDHLEHHLGFIRKKRELLGKRV